MEDFPIPYLFWSLNSPVKFAGSGQEISYSTIGRSVLSENCAKRIGRQKQTACDSEKKRCGDQGLLANCALGYGRTVVEC